MEKVDRSMEAARILIVDDDAAIVELICAYLKQAGFQIATADSARMALAQTERFKPDLVVLDVLLPDMNGLELCRRLNHQMDVGILIVSALAAEADRLNGLEAGADDYLVKPFSPRELVARIKAILRRIRPVSNGTASTVALSFPTLDINLERREVRRQGHPIDLTPLEFQLLHVLASSPGRVFTREQLLQRIWGHGFFGTDRVIDVHIGLLRRKLEVKGVLHQPIQTVRGVGYRFNDE